MGVSDIITEKGSKMTSTQTFILAILLIIITSVVTYIGYTSMITGSANDTDKIVTSINKLQATIISQQTNILDEQQAVDFYEVVFKSSMCVITRMSMLTISNNHINLESRQKQIYKNYTVSIQNMYDNDYSKFDKLTCNGKKLSCVMDKIEPMKVRDDILEIMFNKDISHIQKRIDIERYLNYTAYKFKELGHKDIHIEYK